MEELSYVGKTISDFLSTLAADANNERIFDSLYSDGPTVRVILREALPPVAQQFVMRLAFGGARPFQEAIFRKWCRNAPSSSLQILQRLQILRPVPSPQGKSVDRQVLMLHQNFQASLVKYLTCPHCPESDGRNRPDPESPSEAELMHHAVTSWDAFLEELTRSDSPQAPAPPPSGPPGAGNEGSEGNEKNSSKPGEMNRSRSLVSSSKAIMALAKVLGLHGSTSGTSGSAMLTSKGFQFILDERQQQLWSLILTFLKVKSGRDRAQVLGPLKMIFAIGELKLGQRLLSVLASDRAFVQVLTELGILYGSAGTCMSHQQA